MASDPETTAIMCGNCRWWGERGSTRERRPCLFPLPKWLFRSWETVGDNSGPCPTWERRLPGDDQT